MPLQGRVTGKVNRIRLGTQEKETNAGCIEGVWMTSQLRHNFLAGQTVHAADDATTQNF